MIRVITKLLPAATGAGIKKVTESLRVQAANLAAKGFSEKIEPSLNKLSCEKHPEQTSTVKIIAHKELIITVDKSDFCCQEFADSVAINVKR